VSEEDGSARPSVAVVVVDHDAGPVLGTCLASLAGQGADEVVVVDNGGSGTTDAVVAAVPDELADAVQVVRTGRNVGYGAGANRGVAATDTEVVVVANPDVELHPGALGTVVAAVVGDPTVAVAGPVILEPDGRRYPSARRFPAPVDAAGHALLGRWWPGNPFSRRYRMDDTELPADGGAVPVDWVSGACFAVRRAAWEELGGFDEGYFMYAEDMDLCWRARQAGWQVVVQPAAVVTHQQGVTTRRRPWAMTLAHHRSALRFTRRTTSGWRVVLVPLAAAVLGTRLVLELLRLVAAAARGPGRD
jgi:N-acetylglucosaminyl-diphospho-decaprenol L-rhamnosyltransferase